MMAKDYSDEELAKIAGVDLSKVAKVPVQDVDYSDEELAKMAGVDLSKVAKTPVKQDLGSYAEQTKRGAEMANLDYAAQQGQITHPEAQFRKMGQMAGGVTDELGALAKTGYNTLVSEGGKKKIGGELQKFIESPVGQAGVAALQKGGEVWNTYKQANPRTAGMIEAGVNIIGATPTLGSAAKTTFNIAEKAALGAPEIKAAKVLGSEQRKIYSGALYDEARAKGAALKPEAWDPIEQKVAASMPHEMSLDPSEGAVFQGIKKRVEANKGKPITLDGLEAMDKSLGDLITEEYKKGGATSNSVKLQKLQMELRDMAYNPDRNMVIGDDEGFKVYKEGVKEWSIAKKQQDLEDMITRSNFTDNPATSMKRQLANYYLNAKKGRGYSSEQLALLKQGAESTKFANFLRTTAGSRLIGSVIGGMTGAVGGTAMGGPVGTIVGALGGAATGAASRGTAAAIGRRGIRKIEKSLIEKSGAESIPKEVYNLPPEEARAAIRKIREANRNKKGKK